MNKRKINLELRINETFTLEFQNNSSTGYSWVWVNSQANSIVEKIETVLINDHPERAGASGIEKWTFKGLGTGFIKLKFEYKRAWLESSSIETKEISVSVL